MTGDRAPFGPLETALRAERAAGRKLLVPYITGGLAGLAGRGPRRRRRRRRRDRDRHPVLRSGDGRPGHPGGVAAGARRRARRRSSILDEARDARRRHPAGGDDATTTSSTTPATSASPSSWPTAGIAAAIVPDLPLEESGPWCAAADAAGIETVMLAAPTAPDERLPRIAARARGFVYSVGLLGVTGERDALAATATALAARLKAITDVPVLVGVGVSNAAQAREAVQVADGVIQGASRRAAPAGRRPRRGRRLRRRGPRRDRLRVSAIAGSLNGAPRPRCRSTARDDASAVSGPMPRSASCARRRASRLVLRGRAVLDRRVRDRAACRWSCGSTTTRTRRPSCASVMLGHLAEAVGRRVHVRAATSSTTTCARSRPLPRPRPTAWRLLRPRTAPRVLTRRMALARARSDSRDRHG